MTDNVTRLQTRMNLDAERRKAMTDALDAAKLEDFDSLMIIGVVRDDGNSHYLTAINMTREQIVFMCEDTKNWAILDAADVSGLPQ